MVLIVIIISYGVEDGERKKGKSTEKRVALVPGGEDDSLNFSFAVRIGRNRARKVGCENDLMEKVKRPGKETGLSE